MDTLFALFDRLPRSIGMTPIMRPYVIRDTLPDGRRVLSALTMIAESHVSLHVYPDDERAYFDIFSCRFFDRDQVVRSWRSSAAPSTRRWSPGEGYRYLRTERADSTEIALVAGPHHIRRPPIAGGGLRRPSLIREPMTVADGGRPCSRCSRRCQSAFQGRQLGEAFETWKKMVEGPSLICLGYAASMSSAGMWPLVTWLMERGYVDVLASTSANITEDLLEQMDGTRVFRVDADDVDDEDLWAEGYYRFYDHIVSKEKYDQLETLVTSAFIDDLAERWRKPSITTVRFLHEMGLWLDARGLGRSILATAARRQVPVRVSLIQAVALSPRLL
jgi:hypothetical protein